MFKTPILFIVFNRPQTTFQVFERIREVKPGKLFIAADGPRPDFPNDYQNTESVRSIVQKIDWECEVETLFRDKNLGCGIAVSEAINWFFEHNTEGIILEDDCLPNSSFFKFCAEMLERYRYDKRIISVNGSNLGYSFDGEESYFFSRFMNMWGWATWRRAATEIDYDLKRWRESKQSLFMVYKLLRQNVFDFDINWYKLWKSKFDKVAEAKNFTWDWQWIYYQAESKMLSVVPRVNLVRNIGFNEDATHTHEQNNPAANLSIHQMKFPVKAPPKCRPNLKYEEEAVKWVWCYHKRMPVKNYLINRLLFGLLSINKK